MIARNIQAKARWCLPQYPAVASAKLNQTTDLIDADKRILISQNKEFMESERHIACDLAGFVEYLGGLY